MREAKDLKVPWLRGSRFIGYAPFAGNGTLVLDDHGHRVQPHPPDPRRVSSDGEDMHRLWQRGLRQGRGLRSMRAAPSHGVGAGSASALEEKRSESTRAASRSARVQLVRQAAWSQPTSRVEHRRKRQTTAANRSLPPVPPARRSRRSQGCVVWL
jgi:hypothetical protein